MNPRARIIAAFVLLLSCTTFAHADIRMPSVFGSNMVLQRDVALPVWGWADAGEKVSVTLEGNDGTRQSKTIAADDLGAWEVKLDPIKTGPTYTLTVRSNNELKFTNILAGEVWLCSGQSNMAWPMSRSHNADQAIAAADHPNIRILTVPLTTASSPQDDVEAKWNVCTPQTVASFSAVAYFFGKHLHEELDVPIGLINSTWGGTPVQAWTPRQTFIEGSNPTLQDTGDWLREQDKKHKQQWQSTLAAHNAWLDAAQLALQQNQPIPPRPDVPTHPINGQHDPTALYNGMIAPLVPFAVRGFVWYQGERNVDDAYDYRVYFPAMIESWRTVWNNDDLPFYFAQLAPFDYGAQAARAGRLAELWDSQLVTLNTVPHTGMAVLTDIGNPKDIHPTNKKDVGFRLALWALKHDYGRDIACSGPIYKGSKVEGNAIRITFDHADGLKSSNGQPLTHFTIAGQDKAFVDAEAKIDGDTLIISSPRVEQPVAVRFGWSDIAEPNLMNGAGLPASPFRTDQWKLKTQD